MYLDMEAKCHQVYKHAQYANTNTMIQRHLILWFVTNAIQNPE